MEQNEIQNLSAIIQAISSLLQAAISFLTLIATIILTIVVLKGTRKIASIDYSRSVRDAWLTIDSLALENDGMLVIADDMMSPEPNNDSLDQRRKRWFALMVFNILLSIFEGQEEKFVKDEDAKIAFDQILRPMLKENDIFDLTQTRGYPRNFSKYCQDLKENSEAGK